MRDFFRGEGDCERCELDLRFGFELVPFRGSCLEGDCDARALRVLMSSDLTAGLKK